MNIAIIGTGYVGIITGTGLADFGNRVICSDINNDKISLLKSGKQVIYEPGLEKLIKKNANAGRLTFSNNISEAINKSDIVFITVGTPSLKGGKADLANVYEVVSTIKQNLNSYKLIVIKSTVPVGTGNKIAAILSDENTRLEGTHFDVISNPEFLREGKAIYDFFHPDRIVVGYKTKKAKKLIQSLYRPFYLIETPFIFCNRETAELIKYANNAFLATKITFINQIANLCEVTGADILVVSKVLGMDSRISPKFLHPGPGFGGSCLPKDTKALVNIGKERGVDLSLIRKVIEANKFQKKLVVKKIVKALGPIKGKKISILGLSFKANTDDIRESPAIPVVKELIDRGAVVAAHDPKAMDNFKKLFPGPNPIYLNNEYSSLKGADALVILTEWNQYRGLAPRKIRGIMKGNIIIDTRNILNKKKFISYGFTYIGVGIQL